MVEKGTAVFGLNGGDGTIDWTAGWVGGADPDTGESYSEGELDEFERTYYRKDPFRRWDAYRSGTVLVSDEVGYNRKPRYRLMGRSPRFGHLSAGATPR